VTSSIHGSFSCTLELGGVDDNSFRILFGRDIQSRFTYGGDAVARRDPLAVDEHDALRWSQIDVTKAREFMRDRRPGEKRSAQNPGVGTDLQRILIIRIPARERDEMTSAIGLWEPTSFPRAGSSLRTDPSPRRGSGM